VGDIGVEVDVDVDVDDVGELRHLCAGSDAVNI
jgi:hypothetical protein